MFPVVAKKPFAQKGTGRAAAGVLPVRHKCATVVLPHGPSATSEFATRINKKERRHALRLVLSECLRQGKLTVVNKLEFEAPRTKYFVQMLNAMETPSGLVVLAKENNQIELSGRNVPNSKVIQDGQLNIHDLLKSKCVIMTEAAIEKLEGAFVMTANITHFNILQQPVVD